MEWKKDYLEKAFDLMAEQEALYQSSSFWEEACKKISKTFVESDFNNFRRDQQGLNFFIPTYGFPGNSFSKVNIGKIMELFYEPELRKNYLAQENFLKGDLLANADYRVLKAANSKDDTLDLLSFSESSFGNPIEQFEIEDKIFSRSSLNYLLGLSFLKTLLPNFIPNKVLEIGGGFGTLGEILFKIPGQDIKYIDIDLPPIFVIASEYIRNACELNDDDYLLSSLDDTDDEINIENLPSFSFLPSWEIKQLRGKVDLFVNFISFQEMEPTIVKNYLRVVSDLNVEVVLLRNMREGKQKATKESTGVISPIVTDDYSKFLPDYELIGSNVLPFGYTTVDDFNSELLVFKRK